MKVPMKIHVVAGARPNFMKVGPLLAELRRHSRRFAVQLIHTGQHYDPEMSDIFFAELDLPRPDRSLGVGSGTHAEQTAKVMIAFEKACVEDRPDLVVVVGDVNSTLACAITAKKLCIPVAHVEAGLRSRDWSMPEEVNRIVTDAVSDYLFTPSRDADRNLLQEGIEPKRIFFVGNVMIDCLLKLLPKAADRNTPASFGVDAGKYAVLTLHRPSNVDDPDVFRGIVEVLAELSRTLPVVWPIHPRARKNLEAFGLLEKIAGSANVKLTGPVGYLDMLALNRQAKLIITDSGGLQEEATILRVPCVTLRHNTERPITIEAGCNQLAGNEPACIRAAISTVLDGPRREIHPPELWDGHSAERIVSTFLAIR
jgi:UDP-N-acetylglucosamine 2-epimerase (non-hydrolysing)